jgi:predicted TIM-barrel fold metal-dependent hydrolase
VLKHADKLMFGTDRFVREEDSEMIGVLRDMALPGDIERAVFWGNAARMLGL